MKKKVLKIAGICLICLFVLFVAGLWGITVYLYNDNFAHYFTSYEPLMLYVDDYEGLTRKQYKFESNKGQVLTGYMYSNDSAEENKKGIIVLAHGFGGGGHNSYMDIMSVFAKNGYYIFTYDATGNDESQGLGKKNIVGGLPQGVIDLNYAISFVEESGNFPALPIVLFGHSWGGYSVCSVPVYHPEIKAIAECAGFYSSAAIFESEGKKMAGGAVHLIMPFYRLLELFKYGKNAGVNGIKGLCATSAPVMIVHSKDDTMVPLKYGYSAYYDKFKDDPRFRFILYDNRGHTDMLRSLDGIEYVAQFNEGFSRDIETWGYDYSAPENVERFIEDKAAYIHKYLDREMWANTPNEDLMLKIVDFYDQAILGE